MNTQILQQKLADGTQKKWSWEEDNLLQTNYQTMKVKELAKKLHRSISSVRGRARLLRLHKGINEQQRKTVLDLAKNTNFSRDAIAIQTGMSTGSVHLILRENNIKTRGRRKSQFDLLKGFNSGQIRSGSNMKSRAAILHAYRRTCWDCKKTSITDTDFHIHHDFTRLPVQILLLCKECHGKRHNRNFGGKQ